MINTKIFSVGDITEVKNWLDENATNIFDEIEQISIFIIVTYLPVWINS